MEIEYYLQKIVNGLLEVEDISNCAVEANDDLGNFYYMIINSEMGYSKILEFGPVSANHDFLSTAYQKFKTIEFSQSKLKKVLYEFLNNDLRKITQAKEISVEDACANYPILTEWLKPTNIDEDLDQ